MPTRIVIAGAGPAGITVAETLRGQDRDCAITLLSAEPYPPYAPPAMADHFLHGRQDTLYWKGRDICDRLGLDFRASCSIRSLDTANRALHLADSSTLPFDRLVIATGAGLYAPVPGNDLPGIYNFKSLSAAERLVSGVRGGSIGTALVVGAGFIGVEIALLLQDLGVQVTMIEMQDRLIPKLLEAETAEIVLSRVRARGVEVRLATQAEAFLGKRKVTGVQLDTGERLQADAYVAATGVKPNIDWLLYSGVDTGWGVIVDDYQRTSVEGIYAAGDVAETRDRMTGERYVHAIFPNAVEQARVVANGLLGHAEPYMGAESMNSLKHLGVDVIAGGTLRGSEVLCRRDRGALRKLYLEDGRIVGYSLAGNIRAAGVYRSLMLRRADVRPYRRQLLDNRPGAAWFQSAMRL
jgi:NAD(P)H-nitrite reductase large subunit